MGVSNSPTRVLVQTDASRVFEGEIVADEEVGGGEVVVALSNNEQLTGVGMIGQPGQYGIARAGDEVRVTISGSTGVVEAVVAEPPADAVAGETGLTTGALHARLVPDTVDRFEVSSEDGSVDYLQVDENGTRPLALVLVVCDKASRPPAPVAGEVVFVTDALAGPLGCLLTFDGSDWIDTAGAVVP